MELSSNRYWMLRHGTSLANEAGVIVSSMANGVLPAYGLAPLGREQAAAAGGELRRQLAALGASPASLLVLASPFSRTQQTAALALAAACAGGGDDGALPPVLSDERLRERSFGADLELQSHDLYAQVWARDAEDPTCAPPGGGESVADVAARARALLSECEAAHSYLDVLLVGHGDLLSILAATACGSDARRHREHGLQPAELRRLAGRPTAGRPADGRPTAAGGRE